MAETDTAAHRSKKDAAIDSLCAYRDGSEKHIGLLFEAIGSFEAYLAENGMQIPEIAREDGQNGELEAILGQLSHIADNLFVIKDYCPCCMVLEAAVEIWNQNIATAEGSNVPSESSLLLKLSSCYLQLDRYQDCIKTARLCLKEGIEKGNKFLEMQSSTILANACQRACHFIEAIHYNSKLLGIGRQLEVSERELGGWENQLECKILWNISACFNSINDHERALMYAKEYLDAIKYGSQENLTGIYSYMGKLKRLNGQYKEALHMHELELAICKKYKDRRGMSNAYGSIGLVLACMGDDVISKEYLNQQFLLAKSLEDSELLLNATKSQAESLIQLGKTSPAIDTLKTMLKLARERHLWDVQCDVYRSIGKLYQEQGTLNFARHFLEESMHRAKECGMREDEIDAALHLARVLQTLGYYEEARKHFKEVIIHFEMLIDTLHHYEIKPCTAMTKKLVVCCRDLQDVLVKLKCYREALEIAELSKSRTYFNVIKRRNAKSPVDTDAAKPLTYPSIEAMLRHLPTDSILLYYALSADGYHLWMMTPGKGLVKFVSQTSLASYPLETLIRDSVRSLSVTSKGNRCCYDSENRRKLLRVAERREPGHLSKNSDQVVRTGARGTEEERRSSDGYSSEENVNEQFLERNSKDSVPVLRENRNSFTVVSDLTDADIANDSTCHDLRAVQKNANDSPCYSPRSPFRTQKDSTYDSGYDSCSSRNHVPSRDEAKHQNGARIDSATRLPTVKEQNRCAAFSTKRNADAAHTNLFKELFKRLLGQIDHLLSYLKRDTRIIFIPDGILNMVPFNLLRDKNDQPLHRSFLVSVLPCVAAISKWQHTADFQLNTSIAIGNSTLSDAMFRNFCGDLVSQETEDAEKELNLVSRILGIRALSGREATKDKLIDVLPSADVAHIASIGSITDGFLLFTPNSHRECTVAERESYVFDVCDLSYLELNAKLVILSGCNQCPHGLSEANDIHLDLAAGFIAAGAVAVVVFLYSAPHKMQMYVIHRLFRLLEMGSSVSEALQSIYNEMSDSEDTSHPGYWGGVVLIGRDICVDIRSVRRKELENAIDKSSDMVRGLVCSTDEKIDIDEYNPSTKAKVLQSVMAAVLSEQDSEMVLESLSDLITLSIKQIASFAEGDNAKQLPAVKISRDVFNLSSVQNFLNAFGYKLEPSLEEVDVMYVMLPPWNFDDILERSLSFVQSLSAIRALSKKATFSLSRCLMELDEDALTTLSELLIALHADCEKNVLITDAGVRRLWVSAKIKRFLQDIGFNDVNKSLFLRNGKPYDQLQTVTNEIISLLLSMHEDGERLMSQLTVRKLKKPAPWMTQKSTRKENISKNLLAKRIISTRSAFKTLRTTARDWHNTTLQSWAIPDVQLVQIGRENEEKEMDKRDYFGVLKVKVKPGGTPSSCRLPIIEKRQASKYDRCRQREALGLVLSERRKDLSRRKHLEIYKSFALSDV